MRKGIVVLSLFVFSCTKSEMNTTERFNVFYPREIKFREEIHGLIMKYVDDSSNLENDVFTANIENYYDESIIRIIPIKSTFTLRENPAFLYCKSNDRYVFIYTGIEKEVKYDSVYLKEYQKQIFWIEKNYNLDSVPVLHNPHPFYIRVTKDSIIYNAKPTKMIDRSSPFRTKVSKDFFLPTIEDTID